jgi:hypothetical protein
MNTELTIAELGCAALAAGHAFIGRVVLPALRSRHLPATPFGPPPVTAGMVRFTWHIVTVTLLAFSILLMMLAGPGSPIRRPCCWAGSRRSGLPPRRPVSGLPGAGCAAGCARR